MSESPAEKLIEALDKIDVDGVMSMLAPDARFLTADGRRAHGPAAIRELVTQYFSAIRNTRHQITAQWHEDNVWLAEVEADYELRDWLQLKALPRMFVLRTGPEGLTDVRVYGAHELPLQEHGDRQQGMWIGRRWIPPL